MNVPDFTFPSPWLCIHIYLFLHLQWNEEFPWTLNWSLSMSGWKMLVFNTKEPNLSPTFTFQHKRPKFKFYINWNFFQTLYTLKTLHVGVGGARHSGHDGLGDPSPCFFFSPTAFVQLRLDLSLHKNTSVPISDLYSHSQHVKTASLRALKKAKQKQLCVPCK